MTGPSSNDSDAAANDAAGGGALAKLKQHGEAADANMGQIDTVEVAAATGVLDGMLLDSMGTGRGTGSMHEREVPWQRTYHHNWNWILYQEWQWPGPGPQELGTGQ